MCENMLRKVQVRMCKNRDTHLDLPDPCCPLCPMQTMVQAFKGSMFGSGKKKGAARRGTKVLATPGADVNGSATLIVPLVSGEAAAAASSLPPNRHRPDTANEDKAVPPGKASASQLTDGGSCGSGGSHGTAAAAAAAKPSDTTPAPGAATPPKTPPLSNSASPPPRHGPVSGGALGGGGGGGSTALQVVPAGGHRRLSPLPGAQGTAATGGTPQAPLEQEIKIMFDVTPRVIRVLQQPGNEVATVSAQGGCVGIKPTLGHTGRHTMPSRVV